MSGKHVDHQAKLTASSLAKGSTMGNFFSKVELEKNVSQKGVLPEEETRPKPLPPSLLLFKPMDDKFLKKVDQASARPSFFQKSNDSLALDPEKFVLNTLLNDPQSIKPAPQRKWCALQHYVYFIYRHAISEKPCNSSEIFPSIVSKKIRDLLESLLNEDVTQLCIRLITLIREYAIIARGHFTGLEHPKVPAYLISLMSFYSAFCSAASKLAPLLPEFDFLLMERFNVNWLCLNKSIFYHYVYLSPAVQAKLPVFHKLKDENKSSYKNLLESYVCFSEDMSLIASRWTSLRIKICTLSHKRAVNNPSASLLLDWKIFEEQKKILTTNYWIVRDANIIQIQDMGELDTHLLSLVGDTAYIADFLIDSKGHCMCEDCLAAEFKSTCLTTTLSSPGQPQSSAICRLITCYICQHPVALDAFASHIVTKHHNSNSTKNSRIYLTPQQKRIPKKLLKHGELEEARETFTFQGLLEKNVKLKESLLLNLVNGPVAKNFTSDGLNGGNYKCDLESSFNLAEKQHFESVFNFIVDSDGIKHKTSGSPHHSFASLKQSASPVLEMPTGSPFTSSKEPTFKIASEAPIMDDECEMLFKCATKPNGQPLSCTAAIDGFLKYLDENTDKSDPISASVWNTPENIRATQALLRATDMMSDEDILRDTEDLTLEEIRAARVPDPQRSNSNSTFISSATVENSAFRKPQQKGVDQKMMDFLKTGSSKTAASKNDGSCSGHACGHKCKQEDDKQSDLKKQHACQDTCEHHKESRKCDCAYCEVFGASLPTHGHKINETRDRLRSRLNQRKEKVNEGIGKSKASLGAKLATKTNGSLNCTIKISGNSKISMLNGKSVTANGKVTSKLTPVEPDPRGPPRVPEVNHPVPPPASTKPVLTSVEPKRSSILSNGLDLSAFPTVSTKDGVPSFPSTKKVSNDCLSDRPSSSLSSSSLNSENVDSRDINELLNYIEGHKPIDKAALAKKKADKKARQRIKKAEERERIETENRLKEEARLREEKLKEERRLKAEQRLKAEALAKAEAIAKQLAEKEKKLKKEKLQELQRLQQKQDSKKNNKKKSKNNENTCVKHCEKQSNLIEETIPAMVTIKRIAEGTNSPATVTITLKGSSPETDKLLLTLVNGHNNIEPTINPTDTDMHKTKSGCTVNTTHSNISKSNENQKSSKKKKKKESTSKEMKVTIAVSKNNDVKKPVAVPQPKKNTKSSEVSSKPAEPKVAEKQLPIAQPKYATNITRNDINLPTLRLPPGITITKIEGPPTVRNCRVSNNTTAMLHSQNQNVPVSKSGVIVVDTEKLIQQSITANNNKQIKKKNKKKREQKATTDVNEVVPLKGTLNSASSSSMVTLKNPIFHTLQTSLGNKAPENSDLPPTFPGSQQASIFKNDNGMVTIRSPRLQTSYPTGSPISNFVSDLNPMYGAEVSTAYRPMCHNSYQDVHSPFNAQAILSGLPGIEITKVDKSLPKAEPENRASQAAEVSIIPTNNGVASNSDKFNFFRDDWAFESVFTPKDVLEDDMDADELELEAFKRFCQQSVPPERKEKVAHLNVKDIVLNKKRDFGFS